MAADTVGDVAPQVTQTFSVIQADFFFPLAVGAAVFLVANGLAILRWEPLAAWLGWVAVVLGVLCLTPVGFFAILLMLVWIPVISVMLFQINSRELGSNPARPQALIGCGEARGRGSPLPRPGYPGSASRPGRPS